jgi:hypothetical protein
MYHPDPDPAGLLTYLVAALILIVAVPLCLYIIICDVKADSSADEESEMNGDWSCDVCGSKPVALFGINSWASKFDRTLYTEDMSFLLPQPAAQTA